MHLKPAKSNTPTLNLSFHDPDNPNPTQSTQSRSAMTENSGSHGDSLPDWTNLSVLHRSALPPRASFFPYKDVKTALKSDITSSQAICLSGKWQFHWSPNPFEVPNLDGKDGDDVKWGEVDVPGMWQLQGYGKGPHYTNVRYPWNVDPPNVSFTENETGTYKRTFTVPKDLLEKDNAVRLRLEGVDAAYHVWMNGKEVGYAQGSRNASEFEVGKLLKEGENEVAVRVYQRCDGSYIEDQDQWWLSGIFRDVYLIPFPKVSIQDFYATTRFDSDYKNAKLDLKVDASGQAEVEVLLLDAEEKEIAKESLKVDGEGKISIDVKEPHHWTAESPYLYSLVLSLSNPTNTPQVIHQKIGFRQVEIKKGIFCVNGAPIKLRGVNRHEHHPRSGRAVPYDFMKRDLLLMKEYNINAIRTSHYPNDPRMYALADELGFWVIDEADLECHGFGDIAEETVPPNDDQSGPERRKVLWAAAGKYTSDNPEWKEAYLDRARKLVTRDKNHPCVIIWSLGNEAFTGSNFYHMYDLIKELDPTRPVHYEGDWSAGPADMHSRMYPSVDEVIEFAEKDKTWDKPYVLCEYVHAMGNGPGGIKEYMDAFYKYPRLMGGFVWEWANHGLVKKNEKGEEFYGFGGSFGDEPNDGSFVMDGLLFSNHTPTPGLIEYKKAIEPVQTLGGSLEKGVKIINRYDFSTLDHLDVVWAIEVEGTRIAGGKVDIPKGVKPHAEAVIESHLFKQVKLAAGTYLTLKFLQREDTAWAKAGHVIATGQLQLAPPSSLQNLVTATKSNRVIVNAKSAGSTLEIQTDNNRWVMNTVYGGITSWQKKSGTKWVEVLESPPVLDMWRAPTDNDNPGHGVGKRWLARHIHLNKYEARKVSWKQSKDGHVVVEVDGKVGVPVWDWSIGTKTVYTFGSGEKSGVHIKVSTHINGETAPEYLPRFGLVFAIKPEYENVEWFGRGPGESYRDKKQSQLFGRWKNTVDGLWVDYERPQEGGNKTDVTWVKLSGSDSAGGISAHFGDQTECNFQVSHYATNDVATVKYPYELHALKKKEVIVRLDWKHMGIGTGSCGPWAWMKDRFFTKEMDGWSGEVWLQ